MARSDNVSFGPGFGYQILRVAIVVMTLLSLMPFAASSGWIFELTTNFRTHFFIVLVPLVIAAFLMKGWKIGLVGLVAVAINASWLVPEWSAKPPITSSGGTELRVFYANISTQNLRSDQLVDALNAEQPDVAVLLEVDERWASELEQVKNILPHQLLRTRPDNFGLAVLMKKLPLEHEFFTLADVQVPALRLQTDIGDKRIELWTVHTIPPGRAELQRTRDRQLAALAEKVNAAPLPAVVVGDLNISPWSPAFRRLVEQTGLRDSRIGFGVQPTWPAFAGTFGIPIDHVLVHRSIEVRERRIGDPIGSDHRPLVIVLGAGSGG